MKTNIINYKVDKRKLQEEINKYETINDRNAYLFMNEDTMNAITSDVVKEYKAFFPVSHDMKGFGKIGVYQGNKCYVDNDLAFGEVEIR